MIFTAQHEKGLRVSSGRGENRLTHRFGRLVIVCLILLGSVSVYPAITYGGALRPGFSSSVLPRNDDSSTDSVPIGFTVDFYGQSFDHLYVNNNGNVTFDSRQSTYTPFNLYTTGRRIIAPFFGDVDTRGTGSSEVTYGTGVVNGHPAFGVNWVNVGYYNSKTDKLNSFQLVLIDRSDVAPGAFDFEFNYGVIRWETGDASGGNGGLGGTPARAGFSNGTSQAGASYEISGSGASGAFLDSSVGGLSRTKLNSNQTGRYLFTVRNGTVPTIILTLIPAPADNAYVIAATPKMPQIKASAKVSGVTPDPTASTIFTWSATLTAKDGKNRDINLNGDVAPVNPTDDTNTTTGTQPVTLTVTPTGAFRGGKLKLTAKATVNGQTIEGHTPEGLMILGKNPGAANVRLAIDQLVKTAYMGVTTATLRDTLKKIACHESGPSPHGQRQFNASPNGGVGMPIMDRENGVGVFQITITGEKDAEVNCPLGVFYAYPNADQRNYCRNVIFNWRANVAEGVRAFKEDKIKVVKGYPKTLRDSTTFANYIANTINPARVGAGKPPLPTTRPLSFVPEYTAQQLLYDAIRYYNGFGSKSLYGSKLHEYRPHVGNLKTKTLAELRDPETFWERVPGTRTERPGSPVPDYVNILLATPADCSTSAFSQEIAADTGPSPVLSVKPGTDLLEMRFPVRLDPIQAVDAAHYIIRHNQNEAQIMSIIYDDETHIVRLVLDKPVHEWDELIVSWDLIDLYANPLKGEVRETFGNRSKEPK